MPPTPAPTPAPRPIAALDIGGANLKAACSDGRAWSRPFHLAAQPGNLPHQLKLLLDAIGPIAELRLTMTAELCDCFPTKRQGIEFILNAAASAAAPTPIRVWQTTGRLIPLDQARRDPLLCAAANWLALAHAVAAHFRSHPTPHHAQHQPNTPPTILLIDTGSTTTDLIPIQDHRPQPAGFTDTQRLATGELLYLGAAHTPLIALGPTIRFRGQPLTLINEPFATTADAFLLTGHLPPDDSDTATPDGRPRTAHHAAARILRMISADLESHDPAAARELAHSFARRITRRITRAIRRLTADRHPQYIVASGSGEFLAANAARAALKRHPPSAQPQLVAWSKIVGPAASSAACAHALINDPATSGGELTQTRLNIKPFISSPL